MYTLFIMYTFSRILRNTLNVGNVNIVNGNVNIKCGQYGQNHISFSFKTVTGVCICVE